jgi:DNA polymerase V
VLSPTANQPTVSHLPPYATLEQLPLAVLQSEIAEFLPLISCAIPAGFPSPATDYMEDGLDLNQYLVRHKAATFLFRVQGHSMRDAGIMDGDKVVVDKSVTPLHDHIVIAVIDGEYTIKRLYNHCGRIELRAENPAFKPICFNEFSLLEIWGVVVGVVRRYG